MRIVRQKSTGEILYRSHPEFEKDFGIKNARVMFSGISEADMEEVNVDLKESEFLNLLKIPREKNGK